MSKEDQKKVLEDLKKQITDINFYLRNIKVIPNDRKSVANYNNVIALANNLDKSISDNLWRTQKEERLEKSANIDDNYKTSLASINSPTEEMIKTSESNMAVKNGYTNGGLNIIKRAVELMKKKAAENGSELRKKANNPEKDA